MHEEYLTGEIQSSSLIVKSGGQVVIGIEKEKSNPNGGVYPPKNIVKYYVESPKKSALNLLSNDDTFDDAIPF